jgi:hypothetical protein
MIVRPIVIRPCLRCASMCLSSRSTSDRRSRSRSSRTCAGRARASGSTTCRRARIASRCPNFYVSVFVPCPFLLSFRWSCSLCESNQRPCHGSGRARGEVCDARPDGEQDEAAPAAAVPLAADAHAGSRPTGLARDDRQAHGRASLERAASRDAARSAVARLPCAAVAKAVAAWVECLPFGVPSRGGRPDFSPFRGLLVLCCPLAAALRASLAVCLSMPWSASVGADRVGVGPELLLE